MKRRADSYFPQKQRLNSKVRNQKLVMHGKEGNMQSKELKMQEMNRNCITKSSHPSIYCYEMTQHTISYSNVCTIRQIVVLLGYNSKAMKEILLIINHGKESYASVIIAHERRRKVSERCIIEK